VSEGGDLTGEGRPGDDGSADLDSAAASTVTVTDNPAKARYEIRVDGAVAGFAIYRPEPGNLAFVHTWIDPAFSGRGLGSQLARQALDDVRGRGMTITPLCPFIARFIATHPSYRDLDASHNGQA
jgi:hypothetical protein